MSLEKRSVSLAGHRTSVALEPEFWAALTTIAARKGFSLPALIAEIDATRDMENPTGLASSLRVYVLDFYRDFTGLD